MAMRLFSKTDFEEHLISQLSLTKTDETTDTSTAWKTVSGHYILVPNMEDGETYPDYLLDEVYNQIERLEKSLA